MGTDYRDAGVKITTNQGKATWHSLRKTFVNNLVKQGNDLKTIMTLARHSTASLTMETYAQADSDTLRTAVEQISVEKTPSPCCTGVAQRVGCATRDLVKSAAKKKLEQISKIPATGFEPVTNGL
jgi:hypothetical protein